MDTLSPIIVLKRHLYERGRISATAQLTHAIVHQPITDPDSVRRAFKFCDEWTQPKFPIDGRDVKVLGVTEGPRVGALLHELEQWWIAEDFKPSRAELLARLKAAAKNP
jgi:poly(A) polymerase